MGSIVMDDAVIEDRVMLGAGGLVPPGKVLAAKPTTSASAARRAPDADRRLIRCQWLSANVSSDRRH